MGSQDFQDDYETYMVDYDMFEYYDMQNYSENIQSNNYESSEENDDIVDDDEMAYRVAKRIAKQLKYLKNRK
jgi:hypothetical protein